MIWFLFVENADVEKQAIAEVDEDEEVPGEFTIILDRGSLGDGTLTMVSYI